MMVAPGWLVLAFDCPEEGPGGKEASGLFSTSLVVCAQLSRRL